MGAEDGKHTLDEEKMDIAEAQKDANEMKAWTGKNATDPKHVTKEEYDEMEVMVDHYKHIDKLMKGGGRVLSGDSDSGEYTPEPGSALAEMKKVEEMEQAEEDFAEMEHNQGREEID